MPELLIDAALRGAALLAAAMAATLAMRRAAAATRHLVWALAVAGVLALPAMRAALPAWEVLPRSNRNVADRRVEAVTVPQPVRALEDRTTLAPPHVVAQPVRGVAQRFRAALTTLWALVALVLLGRIAYGLHAIHRLVRHAGAADARWAALLRRARAETAAPPRIRLLVSRDIAMPMTWGRLLLLPAAAAGWSDDRANVVLLHELAHMRRADWITHLLARVAAALHWFNPLAWVALRAMTRERERACDDCVLAHGARPSEYAQHLLDIARAGTCGPAFAAAPAMARASELEGRLLSILTPRRRETGRLVRRALALAGVLATTIVAAASPGQDAPQAPQAERPEPAPLTVLMGDPPERAAGAVRPDARALVRALEDPSPSVREGAALGLALRSGSHVVDPLLRALKDRSPRVREKAAIGLAMRQQPRAVDALLEAMHDADPQVREKVVIALGLSGDPRAQQALIAALDDGDAQVREKAAKALATLPLADAIRGGISGAPESLGARLR